MAIRVALVHDWLTGMRGGEYVLEAISELWQDPHLFTLIAVPGRVSAKLEAIPRTESFLTRLPAVDKHYRKLLPILPLAIRALDLDGYDLVLSSSSCVAKGARRAPEAVHVSYVFAPMRYIWDRYAEYFGPGQASPIVRLAAWAVRPFLKTWDRRVSQSDRVDALMGNSRFIAERIREHYGRDAAAVHSFADLERFVSHPRDPKDFFLVVSAFAPYKRLDLAIEAFNALKLPLWIVGGGQDEAKLRRMAGPTIRFLGELSNAEIETLYAQCRAFIFPGEEDFGITPVEANASGAPVIAYRAGGVLDTLTEKTAVFFDRQDAASLRTAVETFIAREREFREADLRANAARFSREAFKRHYLAVVARAWRERGRPIEALREALQPEVRPWLAP